MNHNKLLLVNICKYFIIVNEQNNLLFCNKTIIICSLNQIVTFKNFIFSGLIRILFIFLHLFQFVFDFLVNLFLLRISLSSTSNNLSSLSSFIVFFLFLISLLVFYSFLKEILAIRLVYNHLIIELDFLKFVFIFIMNQFRIMWFSLNHKREISM